MEIELKNVGIIKSAHLEFIQGLNLIVGSSSSGKSTLLRAIRSMMDNSFTDSNITYGQKKLAIRIQYNGHSATYIRDLDNASRKSAYQIDGKVYTKVGRGSLEDLSSLFKLYPIEIDGEKINFNYSAQFSGPFLLLGSQSLLYSILTYRTTFDITKINDLYFSDYKKIKQDINVLVKTKESLDKEKAQKLDKLKTLEPVPALFIRVQKLKQLYETFKKQSNIYTSYRETLTSINVVQNRLVKLSSVLSVYPDYNNSLNAVSTLTKFNSSKRVIDATNKKLVLLSQVKLKISDILPEFEYLTLLHRYTTLFKKVQHNKAILQSIQAPHFEQLPLLILFIKARDSFQRENQSLQDCVSNLQEIQVQLSKVDVCPLCNQPLHHSH